MTREEAATWLQLAGRALGEQERYWFGSLRDLGFDWEEAMRRKGPDEVRRQATAIVRTTGGAGPRLRALSLFARALARSGVRDV